MAEQMNASLSKLESTLEEYLVKKAPYQLPADVKEGIVKFGPWIILILTLLSLPLLIGAFALTTLSAPFMMMAGQSTYGIIPALVLGVSVVFNFIALPGLFNRTKQGWKYAYYSELLSILSSILYGNIFSAILGIIIGLYILFQVKPLYK